MAWPRPAGLGVPGRAAALYSGCSQMQQGSGPLRFSIPSLAKRMDSADLPEGCCLGMRDIFSVWPRMEAQTAKAWPLNLYLHRRENGSSKPSMHSEVRPMPVFLLA